MLEDLAPLIFCAVIVVGIGVGFYLNYQRDRR